MATPQTVALHTLGCKLNFSETSTIRQRFEDLGYTVSPWDEYANIYVLNTCSVTEFADRKCRAEVRKVLRQNPEARVVVIGCYAQLKPQEIADIPGVDLVLGASEKFNVLHYVDNLSKATDKGLVRAGSIHEVHSFEEAFSFGDRTRTFLKVQDGCDYKCTFCTIPQARGRSRSAAIEQIVANARKIVHKGTKEIVLTGVNIGDFGIDSSGQRKQDFLSLIRALDLVEGIERIRISSIEPNLCTNEIIEFVAGSKKFMPHFHMPLQSGSDRILGQMRRRYKRGLYTDRVQYIKSLMPHCCIGVDVIVGFPGETKDDFLETVHYLQGLDISYLHVFTYSERTNTLAASLGNRVPMATRRERNKQLRMLSEKKRRIFYQEHLGQVRPVLVEEELRGGLLEGFTDNYIKVQISPVHNMENTIQEIQIGPIQENGKCSAVAVNNAGVATPQAV